MAGVLGYTKKFIILKKDFCNMSGLNPKGHGKIEIKGLKGSLSISLENAEENQIYNVLLVDKHNAYNLGKIYTEKNAKGREELDFNISDLESKGFSLEKVNGILVARDTNILLGGYTGKEDGSLERYINSLTVVTPEKVEESEPIIVEEEKQEPEIKVEQNEMKQIEEEPKVEEVIQTKEPEDAKIEEIEVQEEVELQEEIEEVVELEQEDFEPVYEPIADLSNEEEPVAVEPETQEEVINIKEFDYEYNRKVIQKNQTTTYVLSILRYFPYSDPFKVNLSGYSWWRIDYQEDDKGFLPYYSYVVGNNKNTGKENVTVTTKELMAVHGHYIFGLYNVGEDVKYYVYGVPGGFYKDEHPYNGTTGFNTWYPGLEISGYWLLYIDPLTGEVIYPINPMTPID